MQSLSLSYESSNVGDISLKQFADSTLIYSLFLCSPNYHHSFTPQPTHAHSYHQTCLVFNY